MFDVTSDAVPAVHTRPPVPLPVSKNILAFGVSVKVNGYSQPTDVGVAMLSKQLALSEASGQGLIRAMELSVNPGIGGNIDYYA